MSKYIIVKPALVKLALLLAFWSACGASVEACSCFGGVPACQAYGGAAAVFVGMATEVKQGSVKYTEGGREEEYRGREFTFAVEEAFGGVQGTAAKIFTGQGGGDCGYDFQIGERYLVYASRHFGGDTLGTSICTRTRPLSQADEDLAFLRGLATREPGVVISGTVLRQSYSVKKGDAETTGPLAGASLVVEGEGERRELRADSQGKFSAAGLKPGKYKVTLKLPDELTVYKTEQEVSVSDRGCAVVSYYVRDNGRVAGRLLDAEGKPAARLMVALFEADDPDPERHYGKLERTDEEGRYNFSGVPPGRYLIGVNLNRYPEPTDPTNAYPRSYHPGVAQASEAEVISLGAGESVSVRDFRLPPRRAESVVRGEVVWADGSPVTNAAVSFRDVTHHDPQSNYGINADEHGRFEIKGYEGQTFRIEARSNRPYVGDPRRFEPMERAEPVRITLAHPVERVRIIITKLR